MLGAWFTRVSLPVMATNLAEVLHSLGARADRGYEWSTVEDVADEIGEKHASLVKDILNDAGSRPTSRGN